MSGKKGYLPCFSRHKDKDFPLSDFYANNAFIAKTETFLASIIKSSNVLELQGLLGNNHIQQIDPAGSPDDRRLCQKLGWATGKVYRVDYGNTPYRLLFGLDQEERRCFILALDSLHQTRGDKKRKY